MTYCVALRLDDGLIFMSDTRTNAGVDNVSSTRKMKTWTVPGDRCMTLLSSGNLATTQAVVSLLDERSVAPDKRDPSILRVETMFQAAKLIGDTLREVIADSAPAEGEEAMADFRASLIFGGQIAGMEPRLFLIYAAGNFIEASEETPYFQIGETKYGRPIIVRVFDPAMSFEDAVKLLYVSFDSTIKANLSVGMPLDLQIYERDRLDCDPPRRISKTDPTYRTLSTGWGDALRQAFDTLPNVDLGSADRDRFAPENATDDHDS